MRFTGTYRSRIHLWIGSVNISLRYGSVVENDSGPIALSYPIRPRFFLPMKTPCAEQLEKESDKLCAGTQEDKQLSKTSEKLPGVQQWIQPSKIDPVGFLSYNKKSKCWSVMPKIDDTCTLHAFCIGIQRSTRIDLTPSARTHPLFPLLDYIARGIHQQGQRIADIEGRLSRFEQECQSIKQTQTELLDLLQQSNKTTFSLKRDGFEVHYRFINLVLFSSCVSHK